MSNHNLILEEKLPSVLDYNALRCAVSWGEVPSEIAEAALEKSVYSLCGFLNGELVAYARVVGDGGIYLYIQDMIVLPGFQGNGFGDQVMTRLLADLKKRFHKNTRIMLFSAKGKSRFYEKYGFVVREADAPGMDLQ